MKPNDTASLLHGPHNPMITGKLRQDIDRLWAEFWTGGITNPLTVIEQISFLMFSRMLDLRESVNERKAKRLKGKTGVKMIFGPDQPHLRWSSFKHKPAPEMLKIVREEVFPHFRSVGNSGSTFSEYMADAQCLIQKPSLLVSAVGRIDRLPIEDSDTKGDLYEYLLSKLTTAGINGQFRTPRHIIRMMVEVIGPKPTDVIGDPACGTGGFLAAAAEHVLRTNTSRAGLIQREDDEGNKTTIYTGDKLNPDQRRHLQECMFFGFDFDVTMLRIASMNLILHGLDNPNIHYCDSHADHQCDQRMTGRAWEQFSHLCRRGILLLHFFPNVVGRDLVLVPVHKVVALQMVLQPVSQVDHGAAQDELRPPPRFCQQQEREEQDQRHCPDRKSSSPSRHGNFSKRPFAEGGRARFRRPLSPKRPAGCFG